MRQLGQNSVPERVPGYTGLRPRQHEFGAQAADRCGAEREPAAVKRSELHHDRKPQSGAWLALVESSAAPRHLLALRRRQPRTVVVDDEADKAAFAARVGMFRYHLDRYPLAPFAGVVYEISDHLLEVLLLATEP